MGEQEIEVTDNPGESRYEARIGGELAGYMPYKRAPHVIAFLHTDVAPEFEGRGVGGALARGALEAARAEGDEIVPACPFLAGWIHKHPEYQPLVYERKSGAQD